MALFTVLLPVHRPPALLPYAIRSVLQQELTDFELIIICDGAPPETGECAQEYARADGRIKVHIHPKGRRHGELYRHQALAASGGRYVCHIGDDDLWFPNHLTEMQKMLGSADFGHFPQVYIVPPDSIRVRPSNLADENQRRKMRETRFNTFGPTECGYRLSAYRSLAEGWSPAPDDVWTDLYMWRKFFALPNLRFTTRYAVTALHFPAFSRKGMSLPQRAAENEYWFGRIRDLEERELIAQQALRCLHDRIGEPGRRESPGPVDELSRLNKPGIYHRRGAAVIMELARKIKRRIRAVLKR